MRIILALAVALFSTVSAFAQPSNLIVFVAAGQSNEEGRATVATMPAWGNASRLWMLNKNRVWVPAKHPTHFHDGAKGGPSLYTAERLSEAFPNNNIGLIPCARGGTAIKYWVPGGKWFETCIKLIGDIDVAGVVYYQGESDSKSAGLRLAWPSQLVKVNEGFRARLGNPNLPFVYTLLGPASTPNAGYFNLMRTVQTNAFPFLTQPARVVDARAGGTTLLEGDHIDGRSARIVGIAHGDALLEMLPH